MTLGKGRAQAITDKDTALLADELEVHPAVLEAISEVESNGFGWFKDGRMKILFEKHWFYKLTSGAVRGQAVKAGIAQKNWIAPANGGYKDQKNAGQRYSILQKAISLDEESAYQSISMGKYQIMGFNHETCGFLSAKGMFGAFVESEVHQLRALANFLKKNRLISAMRMRDWNEIERKYNGGGLNGRYARKMAKAYDGLIAGKWADYKPGSATEKAVEDAFTRAEPEITPQKPVERVEPKPVPTPATDPKPLPTAKSGGKKGLVAVIGGALTLAIVSLWDTLAGAVADAWQWITTLGG